MNTADQIAIHRKLLTAAARQEIKKCLRSCARTLPIAILEKVILEELEIQKNIIESLTVTNTKEI